MGNDPFWALVAEDNNVETLKEAVKAQEQIETEEWFEDILFQYHVAKGFEWGLKGSKMVPNYQYIMFLTIWDHFGPI